MTIQFSHSLDLTFTFEASYTPGRPATRPSYASGGDPPDPAELNVTDLVSVEVGIRVYKDKTFVWEQAKLNLKPETKANLLSALLAHDHILNELTTSYEEGLA